MRRVLFICLLILPLNAAKVEVLFQGNHTFSAQRLYEELGLEIPFWKKILHKNIIPKVDEKLLPSFQEELQAFYKEQGFWYAKVWLERKKRQVIFHIEEGPPLLVKAISVTSDFNIYDLIPFKKGSRFVVSKFKQMKERIKKRLLKHGYCSYEFNPKAYVYPKANSVYIAIFLQKGKICHIRSIAIKGLKTIPKKVVLDHIYIHPKDRLDLQKIDLSTKRLYSLEYFDAVRFDYSKKINNKIFLQTYLKERKKIHVYKAGLGYETDRGELLSFTYKNLNFHTDQLTLKLYHSKLQKEYSTKLFVPSMNLLGYHFDTVFGVGYYLENYRSFKEKSQKLSIKFLKEFYDLSYSVGLRVSHETIFDTIACIESKKYNQLILFGSGVLDKRDSKLFPTRGYYIDTKIDTATRLLNQSGFFKIYTKTGFYMPLDRSILLAKLGVGQIFSGDSTPPSYYFVAGGAQSNRAYGYRTIYALDTSCQIGGISLIETSLEFRHPFKDDIYGALFWDRTYLSRTRLDLSNHKDGVGIGLLYPSPIGTIKAYFGIDPANLSQRSLSLYIGAFF